MRFGLTASGSSYSMGFDPNSPRRKITPVELMERARAAGLDGIEVPAALVGEADVPRVVEYADRHGMFVNLATGGYDAGKLTAMVELAQRLGAKIVRTVVGGAAYGGDRRPLAGRWQAFVSEVLEGFRPAVAAAEQAGVVLAVENHQDLASEDLLWLCEKLGSEHFGITFDMANPLATAEEPIDFTRRVAPYVRNAHLKDYWIYLSDEGYRLVRCPLGRGAIDFQGMLAILAEHRPDLTLSVEVGALSARHVRVFANDFWPDYPRRSAAQLASALGVVYANARVGGDWRTPYERNEPVEAIIAYEEAQLAESLANLRAIRALYVARECARKDERP